MVRATAVTPPELPAHGQRGGTHVSQACGVHLLTGTEQERERALVGHARPVTPNVDDVAVPAGPSKPVESSVLQDV